jgi:hypothetical protein
MPRILLSFMATATATAVLVSGISPVNAQTHPSNSGPKEGASLRQEPPETKIFDGFDKIVQKLPLSCSGTTPEGQTTLSFKQDNTSNGGIVQTIEKTTQLDFKNGQTEGTVTGQWTVERTISPSRFQTIAYKISFSGKANSPFGGDPQTVLGGELAKARANVPEGFEKILESLSRDVSALCQ